jgi:hypothetical protein
MLFSWRVKHKKASLIHFRVWENLLSHYLQKQKRVLKIKTIHHAIRILEKSMQPFLRFLEKMSWLELIKKKKSAWLGLIQ